MTKKLRNWLLVLIFLNGYISMALELIVVRQLGFYVGSSAVITSIIIGTFLGFMSLGYWRGSAARLPRHGARDMVFKSFLVIAILGALACSFAVISAYFSALHLLGITSSIAQTFIYSLLFLSAGPFLFGFNTALLSRHLHKYNANYTGTIMAWDTIGSVLGSMATTLLLMPFIGVNYTIVLITALALFSALMLQRKWWVLLLLIPIIWINSNSFLHRQYGIIVNNANSTISIEHYGSDQVLNMNGLSMSVYNRATGAVAGYINYINNNFIYNMPRDRVRNILVLGAGGFTAGLNDTFNRYTFVDIEKTLKDVAEKDFLGQNLSSNKRFVVADASQYLKNTDEKYDLILLDVYSDSYRVPENLITVEFMQRIRSRVADNGIILMNVLCDPGFSSRFSQTFDNTFHSVFTNNFSRYTVSYTNPWVSNDTANVVYAWYNRPNTNAVYTINKTPVIYDR